MRAIILILFLSLVFKSSDQLLELTQFEDNLPNVSDRCRTVVNSTAFTACGHSLDEKIQEELNKMTDVGDVQAVVNKLSKTICCGIYNVQDCMVNVIKDKCTADDMKAIENRFEEEIGGKPGQVLVNPADHSMKLDCTVYPKGSDKCSAV